MRGQRRIKLRFRSSFKSVVKGFAGKRDFLDDFSKLIDFDRKNSKVPATIFAFRDGIVEGFIQPFHTVAEKILKSNEQRELKAPVTGFAQDIENVDGGAFFAQRGNGDVT